MRYCFAKIIALLALFPVVGKADVQTINDTRMYVTITTSVSGPSGCTLPKDLDKPDPGDPNECRVQRSKVIKGGELLVRDVDLAMCARYVYSSNVGTKTNGVEAPELSTRKDVYKCGVDGKHQ